MAPAPAGDATRPWLQRADWASGRIPGSNPLYRCLFYWVFAVFWCSLSGLASWSLLTARDAPNHRGVRQESIALEGIFAIGFPLIGLAMLAMSVVETRRAIRFGRSYLTMDGVPGVPGGILSGRIACAVPAQLEPVFNLRLSCVYIWSSGTSKSRDTWRDQLWSDEYECPAQAAGDLGVGSSVPVRFDLPASAVTTGPYQVGTVEWTLRISSSLPGIDYADAFEVPVYRAEIPAGLRDRDALRPVVVKRTAVHDRVLLSEEGGTLRVVFPPAMNPMPAYMGSVLVAEGAWTSWTYAAAADWPGALISGALAIPLLYCALRAWLMRTTVTVSSSAFVLEKALLFLSWRRELEPSRITDIVSAPYGRVGEDNMFKLKVVAEGRRIAVGSLLRSGSEAGHIMRLMLAYARPATHARPDP